MGNKYTNRAEQATSGLDIVRDGDVVRVRDGQDTWLCRRDAWDAAVDGMVGQAALDGDSGEAEAYGELCSSVRGPVASLNGSDRGDREAVGALILDAIAQGVVADDEDLARRV